MLRPGAARALIRGMNRPLSLALLSVSLLAAALAGSVGGADAAKKKCKPGVYKFDGSTSARRFCGPASAKVTLASGKVAYKPGSCQRTKSYFTINIGAVVLGSTSKKRPESFGITVGKTPAGGSPAPSDGTYTGNDAHVAFVHRNKGYSVTGASVTLKGKRTAGSFSGTALGQPVSGTFKCR
jgi:hypothetical protein